MNLVEIVHRELQCSRDIQPELTRISRWYLMWRQGSDGSVVGVGSTFRWSRKVLRDIVRLWNLGVRGTITFSESNERSLKFELTQQGVEGYQGVIAYPETPHRIYTKEEDVS